jgi:hypothetical protein
MGAMEIGKPQRVIRVEPVKPPVRKPNEQQPARPAEPVTVPAR